MFSLGEKSQRVTEKECEARIHILSERRKGCRKEGTGRARGFSVVSIKLDDQTKDAVNRDGES